MKVVFTAFLLFLAAFPYAAKASSFLNLINTSVFPSGGSIGSPVGFDPNLGAPGLVFDVLQDFTISAVSFAVHLGQNSAGDAGPIYSTANILQQDNSGLQQVANSTATVSPSGDMFLINGIRFEWYDIPLSFSFLAGQTYSVQLPFWEYSSNSGAVFYVYSAFPSGGGSPFLAETVASVTSATLLGNYQAAPLMGFMSNSPNIVGTDRTFGFVPPPPGPLTPVPLPASLPILLAGLALLLRIGSRRRGLAV